MDKFSFFNVILVSHLWGKIEEASFRGRMPPVDRNSKGIVLGG